MEKHKLLIDNIKGIKGIKGVKSLSLTVTFFDNLS